MTSNGVLDLKIPGSDIVAKGLEDIRSQRITAYSLLLQVAAPRLRRLDIEIPNLPGIKNPEDVPYEHQLYDLIKNDGGHGLYNALCSRIASFASSLETRKPRTDRSPHQS
jgi:hypothetical protein